MIFGVHVNTSLKKRKLEILLSLMSLIIFLESLNLGSLHPIWIQHLTQTDVYQCKSRCSKRCARPGFRPWLLRIVHGSMKSRSRSKQELCNLDDAEWNAWYNDKQTNPLWSAATARSVVWDEPSCRGLIDVWTVSPAVGKLWSQWLSQVWVTTLRHIKPQEDIDHSVGLRSRRIVVLIS